MNAAAAILLIVGQGTKPPDACIDLLPKSLVAAAGVRYPHSRLVRASDYAPQDRIFQADGTPNPCPGVARADVDGNGLSDYAIFVTSGPGCRLVAARALPGDRWSFATLADFGSEGVSRSYVEHLESGNYADLFESESPQPGAQKEPGGAHRLVSENPGFIAGSMESSGAAYFYISGRWRHVWLSD